MIIIECILFFEGFKKELSFVLSPFHPGNEPSKCARCSPGNETKPVTASEIVLFCILPCFSNINFYSFVLEILPKTIKFRIFVQIKQSEQHVPINSEHCPNNNTGTCISPSTVTNTQHFLLLRQLPISSLTVSGGNYFKFCCRGTDGDSLEGCGIWKAEPRLGRNWKVHGWGAWSRVTCCLSSTDFKCTFSQPSGGSLARKRLICGDVPSLLLSWSGLEPWLPPEKSHSTIIAVETEAEAKRKVKIHGEFLMTST